MRSIVSRLFADDTPIQLMIEHAKLSVEVSDVMEELVKTYLDGDDIDKLVKFIMDNENKADDVKFKLRRLLERNVKVPFARSDLVHAMHLEDDIMDLMKDIARKMSINQLSFTLDKKTQEDFFELVGEVHKIVNRVEDEITQLQDVMASAFSKRERRKEEKDIEKIGDIEHDIDKLTLKLGKWSYSQKEKLNPIDLIFFNELVLLFAEIADRSQNLAEMLRSFIR